MESGKSVGTCERCGASRESRASDPDAANWEIERLLTGHRCKITGEVKGQLGLSPSSLPTRLRVPNQLDCDVAFCCESHRNLS
ncbi:MAG: hypothetical protein JWM54_347 [Acidobacteriaceae bacterium]|nr:hypothetical protein [Acidobacteriaceae bacterium]